MKKYCFKPLRQNIQDNFQLIHTARSTVFVPYMIIINKNPVNKR